MCFTRWRERGHLSGSTLGQALPTEQLLGCRPRGWRGLDRHLYLRAANPDHPGSTAFPTVKITSACSLYDGLHLRLSGTMVGGTEGSRF